MKVLTTLVFFGVLALAMMPVANAQTVSEDCSISWDYLVEDEAKIDGYRLKNFGATVATLEPSLRVLPCADATLEVGALDLTLTAFNAAGESGPSNNLVVTYVDSIPASPTGLRLSVNVNVNVNVGSP